MEKEFIPYEQALELKELGFNEECFGAYIDKTLIIEDDWLYSTNQDTFIESTNFTAPLYQQAFRWFREKYNFTYSIGNTNIAVVHYLGTTQLLQNNDSYEAAELAAIKWFIDVAKQQ